jgi:hypothetical protein
MAQAPEFEHTMRPFSRARDIHLKRSGNVMTGPLTGIGQPDLCGVPAASRVRGKNRNEEKAALDGVSRPSRAYGGDVRPIRSDTPAMRFPRDVSAGSRILIYEHSDNF